MGFEPPMTTRQHRGLTAQPHSRQWAVGVGRQGHKPRRGGEGWTTCWEPARSQLPLSVQPTPPPNRGRTSLLARPVRKEKAGRGLR